MPRFRYRATDQEGRDASGTQEAASASALTEELGSQGYQGSDIAPAEGWGRALPKLGAASLSDLLLFNEQLRSMLSRDLPLPKALKMLAKEAWSRRFGKAVEEAAEAVERGQALSAALTEQTGLFPPLYLHVVEAGEASQNLPGVLGALTQYSRAVHGFQRKLVAAAMYPAVTLAISLAVVGAVMTLVVPQFATMYEEIGRDTEGGFALPALTRSVFRASSLLVDHPVECGVFIVAAAASIWALRRVLTSDESLHAVWDRLRLRLPGGRLYQRLLMMRFCHTLSVLLKASVPLDRAIALTHASCGSAALAMDLSKLQSSVSEGASFSEGLEREVRVFPHAMRFMLATAERRSDLPNELGRLAEVYEDEIDVMTRTMAQLWEPIFIIMLGGAVGTLVIALFQPLIRLMGSIGQ